MNSYAQDIDVGPVHVDTGNNWLDITFVLIILIAIAIIFRR